MYFCRCVLLHHRWSTPFGKWQVCERTCCRGYDHGIRRIDTWFAWTEWLTEKDRH